MKSLEGTKSQSQKVDKRLGLGERNGVLLLNRYRVPYGVPETLLEMAVGDGTSQSQRPKCH